MKRPNATEPLPFLKGPNLALRPLQRKDAYGPYAAWFNDPEVCAGNGHYVYPYTVQDALAYIERTRRSRDELVLAITLRKSGRHIGNIALQKIHPVYRSAELAIVIGDKRSWGRGYSKEAARLLMDHGFFRLNLNRIHCGTFETNAPMKRLAAFLGMRQEGRRRRAAFKNNRRLDILEYGVLREEYVRRFGGEG